MIFSLLKTRVGDMIGNRAISTVIGDWLNFAQRDLAHRIDFEQLLTSSTIPSIAGFANQIYSLPTDLDRLTDITWKGAVPALLTEFSTEEYDFMVPHPLTVNDEGEPRLFFKPGANTYGLYPVPNTTSNQVRRYFKIPVDMVNPGDSPSIPEKYHHELIWLGYWWGRMYEQDPEASAIAAVEFEKVVKRISANESKHRRYNRGFRSIQDLRTNTPSRWRS